jgi:hypothetical protein
MTTASVKNNRLLDGFHRHHVVPRHLGGTDAPSNLVMLHPYDHAIAHFVRWKMYGTDGDAWAFNRLKGWLDDGSFTVKGMHHSRETKKLIGQHSASRIRKPHTQETKEKISAAKAGKVSNRKGSKHSAEAIQKMRESHIGQEAWNKGSVGVMTAWNKGLTGKQAAWNKGVFGSVKWSEEAKRMQSERVRAIWAKRKQEALCRQQVL